METRDLLLLIGFLRGGKMFPLALTRSDLPAQRSLRLLYDAIAEQEHALFGTALSAGDEGPGASVPSARLDGGASGPRPRALLEPLTGGAGSRDDLRRRSAVTAWSGDFLAWTSRIGEVPDPGVVLCLMYEGPAADAALPIDVFAQTLRRFALRDPAMRLRFEEHVDRAGTFVPPWLSPEARRQRSQEAFDRAMKVARAQGFAAAAPLFEGVRGDCFAPAQIAIAVHELRELGDTESALGRLDEVVRVAPRNVAARMQRAQILVVDASRRVDAAADWLAVLRELGRVGEDRPGSPGAPLEPAPPSDNVSEAARAGLWALHREFANPRKLAAAAELVQQDTARGYEAVSRYVHTHPCAWDAHVLLGSLSLARESFELTVKLLAGVRWLYATDPTPHFVYGQALASRGEIEPSLSALEHAARIAPEDAEIARWLRFARGKHAAIGAAPGSVGVEMAHEVARSLLLLVGFVRGGRVHPAALTLHRVPGDVSLALVVQALAAQEQRRFGPRQSATEPTAAPEEIDLGAVGQRAVLLDERGSRLSVEQLVGDVSDPGVVMALLYEPGAPLLPAPAECRQSLVAIAQADTEIAARIHRHRESPDATLMARLDRAG